jgi:hypothetical protein
MHKDAVTKKMNPKPSVSFFLLKQCKCKSSINESIPAKEEETSIRMNQINELT